MQPITINGRYKVSDGPCANIEGKATAFDSTIDEVYIQVDPFTMIITHSDNVQEIDED
jgi:hypothetical protein